MKMCRLNVPPIYECVQWQGSNKEELETFIDGKVGNSPFNRDQLTIRGGSAYQLIDLTDWLLRDPDGAIVVVDNVTFQEYYEFVDA